MKVSQGLTILAFATQTINAASIPDANHALAILSDRAPDSSVIISPDHTLERRKGGGGRAGGGSSSSGSSSGSGRSGSSGSSSGGSSSARTGSGSSAGGSTSAGSGAARGFGGGRYYGGGAAVPYSAGLRTPSGLIAGALIAPALLLGVFSGLWLYNVYPYHYNDPYTFNNQSAANASNPNGVNTTLPVTCLCQQYSVCGCDENGNSTYLNDLVGNGSYAALNQTVVTVADLNGTQTLVINGTLPNGTTAPGGTDDSAAVHLAVGKYAGYWAMGLIVLYGVFM